MSAMRERMKMKRASEDGVFSIAAQGGCSLHATMIVPVVREKFFQGENGDLIRSGGMIPPS